MARFSIIMPCYNAAKLLQKTLDSVSAQTFQNWELLCMDDGSTDETPRIIARAAARDVRIKAFRQENSGPALARNRLAELSTGEIIAFLDSDDLWVPEKLQQLENAFRQPDSADGYYSRVAFFNADVERPGAISKVLDRDLLVRDLIGENPVCTMSNIAVTASAWRRSGGIDPQIVHSEDLEWLIRLVASDARICGLPNTLTYYRANESGLSADLAAMHKGWARAVISAQGADPSIDRRDIAAGEAIHLRYLARRALRTGQSSSTAISFALRGLTCSPRGFFSPARRGLAVLGGSLIAPFLPNALRRFSFQE